MKAEKGHSILVFLLSILTLIVFPIILVLSIPFLLFRFIVAKSAPYLRPKLGKIVTTRGCIFAADDYTNFPNANMINVIVLEGQVDLENAIKSAENRLLDARCPNGDLKYPELKQYVTTWAGYYFWKDDEDFDIKNHIKIQQDQEKYFEDDLQELRQNMIHKLWAKKRPMWDITFVPNCYPLGLRSSGPHTALIVRFHHTYGDGYSWFSLMVQELCESEIQFARPNYPKRSFCGNIQYQVTFPFRVSYNVAEALSIRFQKNIPFRKRKGMPTGKYNLVVSDIISLTKMKEIRAHFNVSFSSVISAAIAGAIRDLLVSKRMEIPRVLHVITAQPLPGHSLKLRNYFTGAILKFPTGEDDPVKRLKYCNANYSHLKQSAESTLFEYGSMLVGSCFSWMIKHVWKTYSVTSGISNFVGPSTYSVHFNGHKWIDYSFSSGLPPGACGLAFCALSFEDGFRVSQTACAGVLSTKELKELSALIIKQVEILYERMITNV